MTNAISRGLASVARGTLAIARAPQALLVSVAAAPKQLAGHLPALPWKTARDAFEQAQRATLDNLVAWVMPQLSSDANVNTEITSHVLVPAISLDGHLDIVDLQTFTRKYEDSAKDLGHSFTNGDDELKREVEGVGGFTDKKNGKIWLKDNPQTGDSVLENAVHEAIHLMADPPGSGALVGSFRNAYGGAGHGTCDEAITHYFTKRFLQIAGIATNLANYSAELAEAEKLVAKLAAKSISADVLLRAYFLGKPSELMNQIKAGWSAKTMRNWLVAMQSGKLSDANAALP